MASARLLAASGPASSAHPPSRLAASPALIPAFAAPRAGLDEAILRNVEACKQLAAITRTSLGPNSMKKLVINHLEKLFVTSDAATIVQELEVAHPAARMLVQAAKMQEQEVRHRPHDAARNRAPSPHARVMTRHDARTCRHSQPLFLSRPRFSPPLPRCAHRSATAPTLWSRLRASSSPRRRAC